MTAPPQRLRFAEEEKGAAGAGLSAAGPPGPRSWPDAVAYQEAVQNPALNLSDPDLRASSVALNRRGLPLAYTGRFAVVFRLADPEGNLWALRCFTTAPPQVGDGRAARYEILSSRLAAPAVADLFVPFRYQRDGIRVGRQCYPTLVMGWAGGEPLGRFVEKNLHNPAALLALAATLGDAWARMRAADVAHGDWQHDNLLISEGGWRVRLVDYDGVYVDDLALATPGERGHPNYQHPARTDGDYGPDLDRFPCLLMQTALLALATEPTLWQSFCDGESLLFRKQDLDDPEASPLFNALRLVGDSEPELGALVSALEAACRTGAPPEPAARAVFERAAARRGLALKRPDPVSAAPPSPSALGTGPRPKLAMTSLREPVADPGGFVVEVEAPAAMSPQVAGWMDAVRRMVRRQRNLEQAHLWTMRMIYVAGVLLWFAPPTDWWELHTLLWGSLLTAVGFFLWPTNQVGLNLEAAESKNFGTLVVVEETTQKTRELLRRINGQPENLSAVAFVADALHNTRIDSEAVTRRAELTSDEVLAVLRAGVRTLNDVSPQAVPVGQMASVWDRLLAVKKSRIQEAQEAYAAVDRQRRDLQRELDRLEKEKAGLLEIDRELKQERAATGEPGFARYLLRLFLGIG